MLSNAVVIGKPDFHKIAIDNAKELAGKGAGNLLLIPIDVIVELCLRKVEGKLTRENIISWLENQHGYSNREDFDL
jgi:hypothetical protein